MPYSSFEDNAVEYPLYFHNIPMIGNSFASIQETLVSVHWATFAVIIANLFPNHFLYFLSYCVTAQSHLPGCCETILSCSSNPFAWPHLITQLCYFPSSTFFPITPKALRSFLLFLSYWCSSHFYFASHISHFTQLSKTYMSNQNTSFICPIVSGEKGYPQSTFTLFYLNLR